MNTKKNFMDWEKLNEICQYFGVTMAEFATKNDLKKSEIYQVSGKKQLYFSRDTLINIVKNCPEISPYWLITGEGSMLGGSVEAHHNAVATDHSTATVTHSENTDTDTATLITSQQQIIERLTRQNEQQAEQINRLHGMIESLINKQ